MADLQAVDILVVHGHLFTMQGEGVGYISDGALAIQGNRIVATGGTAEITGRYRATTIFDASNKAVLPGFIDAHMHTPLAIVRGVAQDVWNWMQAGLAPYSRHLTPHGMRAGTRLNIVEALRAGTTTFGDYAFPVAGWAENYVEAGARARLTPTINAMPKGGMAGWKIGDVYPLDKEVGLAAIEDAVNFADRWHGAADGRLSVMLGPQGADMLDQDQLLLVKQKAEERDLMIHLHLAQGDREIDQMVKRYGLRTPDYLQEIGYLNERLLGVHLTEATEEETRMIAESGARMALCSGSIGIIDGIVPPAHTFLEAGGLVCLGSDQASGNNCNNMFNEMKLTALFNKIKYKDPTVMPAWQVLRLATIDGARAVGLGAEVGSLEVGKKADLILVDLTQPNLMPILQDPIRNIVPNLVYAGTGREVTHVIIDGKLVVEDGAVLTLDEAAVQAEAQAAAEEIAANVAADPVHQRLALLQPMSRGQL
ncbi:MAG: amidohydrolase family protein [Anaerolineales bacterium]|nr:amidohydrolase family protein [Anaerolineales bacterium]